MLIMTQKGIRGGTCHEIRQEATANNKYMKNHKNDKQSSYLMYWDGNNLYGWVMGFK